MNEPSALKLKVPCDEAGHQDRLDRIAIRIAVVGERAVGDVDRERLTRGRRMESPVVTGALSTLATLIVACAVGAAPDGSLMV